MTKTIIKTQKWYWITEQIKNWHKIKEHLTEEELKEKFWDYTIECFEALTSIKDSTQDILD